MYSELVPQAGNRDGDDRRASSRYPFSQAPAPTYGSDSDRGMFATIHAYCTLIYYTLELDLEVWKGRL